ncbi:hypothetical protein Y032_0451g1689 [Ancylostoma ceylanicum]|uniref:Secreted protein n=1 Tax=Ancylostoma ceylanicum TaxID=53326 RepID=A0A016WZQ0_9BILA|nr:hypothetical protein Y032_0451g1689 [Ancylostoma ceylanicum]
MGAVLLLRVTALCSVISSLFGRNLLLKSSPAEVVGAVFKPMWLHYCVNAQTTTIFVHIDGVDYSRWYWRKPLLVSTAVLSSFNKHFFDRSYFASKS